MPHGVEVRAHDHVVAPEFMRAQPARLNELTHATRGDMQLARCVGN